MVENNLPHEVHHVLMHSEFLKKKKKERVKNNRVTRGYLQEHSQDIVMKQITAMGQ